MNQTGSGLIPTRPPRSRPDEVAKPVVVRSHRYPDANAHGPHTHRKAQLVWSDDGVVRVGTPLGTWVAPPSWAVWVTSWLEHDVQATADCTMHGVYIDPDGSSAPLSAGPVAVTPLLRELLLSVLDLGDEYQLDGPEGRLVHVLLDQLHRVERSPVAVPTLTDPLLIPIAAAPPADDRTLAAWGREVGASERTLARRFRADAGTTFHQWRTQVRLARALELLAEGSNVGTTARAVGYTNQSAFIATFRRVLGTTPAAYFRSSSMS